MKRALVAALAACMLTLPPAAQALVVFDPSNLAQNLATAQNTYEQVQNQIRQLQNQADMLTNQRKHLTSLDFSALSDLRASLADTNRLIQQAKGLTFSVAQMEREFARLYPEAYSASTTESELSADAQTRWRNLLESLRTATSVQSQAVQNFKADEQTLADLLNRSQSAVGSLQATQATNQLLALQARQSLQAQQLQATHDRAMALEQARQVAAQERARETRRRFQTVSKPYTPYPVSFHAK